MSSPRKPAAAQAAKPAANVEWISKEGRDRIQAEMNELYQVERPRVVATVAAAAAEGDRSENAEYIYGKKRLREIDHRLEFLSHRLDAVQVKLPPIDCERVDFLSWVEVEDNKSQTRLFCLVGADESDVKQGLISYKSPVGQALLGKEVDDTVRVATPKGAVEYTIIEIYNKKPE